jgi:hypothetical protein
MEDRAPVRVVAGKDTRSAALGLSLRNSAYVRNA